MNAIEFVKEHGFNEAKIIVSTYPNHTHVTDDARMFINAGTYKKQVPHFADSVDGMVKISDIKQIVDAFELVEKVGGVDGSKVILASIKPWHTGYNIVSKTYFGGDIFSPEQEFYISDLLKAINLVEQCQ